MTEINLKPYARKFIVSSDDAWIFNITFQQFQGNLLIPVDIRGFEIKAKLFQKIDGVWNKFLTFDRKPDAVNLPSAENGIYLDQTDDFFSTIAFAFDWIATQPAESETLQDGEYRLKFWYKSPLGYGKLFLDYLVDVNHDVRTDELPQVLDKECIVIGYPPTVSLKIYNTRIS